MKLIDLHPQIWGALDRPGTCGSLAFDCPKCGPRYIVHVNFHREAPADGVWQIASPTHLYAEAASEGAYWGADLETLTLVPSIRNNTHGRKHPECGWHGSVTNGEVT